MGGHVAKSQRLGFLFYFEISLKNEFLPKLCDKNP